MKTLKEISTHKAVKENNVINIYEKGMEKDAKNGNGEMMFDNDDFAKYPDWFTDTMIDSIPSENEEDLFAIFEILEENNRCNVAEANFEFNCFAN